MTDLRADILAHEEAGRTDAWESWLPSQRPNGVLGSRWIVSTKAVFIGLNAVSILLALPNPDLFSLGAGATLLVTSAALLTNPKE